MRVLKKGDFGTDVMNLQKALIDRSYAIKVDGIFGTETEKALINFQKWAHLAMDGIAGRNTYIKLNMLTDVKRMPDLLVIHCTASSPASGWRAENFKKMHVNQWGRAGYHKMIERDGNMVETWPLDLADGLQTFEIAYGAAEYNAQAVHICYIGGIDGSGKPTDNRSNAQRVTMAALVKEIIDQVPDIKACGHNQLHNKACPSFWVPEWLESIGIEDKNIYKDDRFGYEQYLKQMI